METKELITECPACHSNNVYGITRVSGYFSKTSMWNNGKLQENLVKYRTPQKDWEYKKQENIVPA